MRRSTRTAAFVTVAFLSLIIWLSPGRVEAQSPDALKDEEGKYELAANAVKSVEAEIQRLRDEINQRVRAVDTLKTEGSGSYLQQQKLKRLLQEAQERSGKVLEAEITLRAAILERERIANKLLRQYEAEIAKIIAALEIQAVSQSVREAHYRKLESLRRRQKKIRMELLSVKLRDVKLNEMEISMLDSPRKIRQKADLLRDHEDKLRKLARNLQEQYVELEKEVKLRDRMSELVTDLAIFDQQEDVIGGTPSQVETPEAADPTSDFVSEGRTVTLLTDISLVGQKTFDYESLSAAQLELIIEQLKAKRTFAVAQADSVAKRAKVFDAAADALRKK